MTRLWFGLLTLMVACSIGVSTGTAHGMALSRLPSAQLREQCPPPRIGFLALTRTEADPGLEGLRQGLAQLGYKDGETVTLEPRFAATTDEYPSLIAELVAVPADVIVSTDSVAVAAAKEVTSTIPIVLQGTGNPVPAKLVTSLDRPGGNGRQAFLATNKDRIVQLAAGTGLPAMYSTRELVAAGGLMGYGASEEAIAQRTAGVVDRILKGANPAEMPIEQATSFELVVNMKTAQALGLMIPQSVLDQATEIIQ